MMSKNQGQKEIKLSVRVENIVGKRKIALNEQFFLFTQCFQKFSIVDASK